MQSSQPTEPQRSIGPVVFGFILAGALILGLGFWAGGRERDAGERAPGAVPTLAVVEPAAGAVLQRPASLVFETAARLHYRHEGWMAGRLHLHAAIDGLEVMPARVDVEPLEEGRYRLHLPDLQPGRREIRLVWAGPDHRTLSAGASEVLVVEVR